MRMYEGVKARKARHMKVEHCELTTLHLMGGIYRELYMT